MSWYKVATESLDKKYIGTVDKEQTKVYVVNGGFVRDNFDDDFVWGGHGYVYKWIPKDEIWIERHDTDEHDMKAIIEHELEEYMLMKYKHMPYEQAHEIATKKETKFRQETPVQ